MHVSIRPSAFAGSRDSELGNLKCKRIVEAVTGKLNRLGYKAFYSNGCHCDFEPVHKNPSLSYWNRPTMSHVPMIVQREVFYATMQGKLPTVEKTVGPPSRKPRKQNDRINCSIRWFVSYGLAERYAP
jgi:hypothetical protein